jgi:UDP-N-acetylmuramyl tripeptide synthase
MAESMFRSRLRHSVLTVYAHTTSAFAQLLSMLRSVGTETTLSPGKSVILS